MSEQARIRVLFSGNVHGVGFRATARSLAHGMNVGGFVRNLPDGSVEMVAEGSRNEVENFVGAVESRMGGVIRGSEKEWSGYTGEFDGFDIRF